jgi:hypothetical protein
MAVITISRQFGNGGDEVAGPLCNRGTRSGEPARPGRGRLSSTFSMPTGPIPHFTTWSINTGKVTPAAAADLIIKAMDSLPVPA